METMPADVGATIRVARLAKNYATLENAAKAAALARKYDTAHKLLAVATEIRASVSGEKSVEHSAGFIKPAV